MNAFTKFKNLFNPIDLTKGSILKDLLIFTIPIILSLAFQQIYTLTDAIIVGQTLSQAEVAGVNNSSSVVFIVLDFGLGATAGFSVLTAQAIGAKNDNDVRRSYFIQIILCIFMSLFLSGIGIALIPKLLGWLGIHASTDAAMQAEYSAASTYLIIIFAGIICQVFYNMIVSILRALGDSFFPFLFLLGSTALNIGLDCLFIIVFRWGVAGSAWATVISQGLAAIGAMVYAYFRYPVLRIKGQGFKSNGEYFLEHIKNGFPLGFQFSVLAIGIIIMQAAIIKFDIRPDGTMIAEMPAQMGYGAGCKVINLLMVPLMALGTALLSFVAQNAGAKDGKRVKQGFLVSFYIGNAIYLILLLIGLLITINGTYQYLFLSADKISEASIQYGNAYLYISVPCLWFLMVLFLIRNAMQGLSKPLWPLLSGVGELTARVLVCTLIPLAIAGGAVTSLSGIGAFCGAALGDPIAWIASPLISLIPMIKAFKQLPTKEEKRTENQSKDI